MQIAHQTLKAIHDGLVIDQGAKYRGLLAQTMPECGDAYSTKEEDWRGHLGASLLGRECAREIWYGFRWSVRPRFDGRMLRLFNRGHLEEGRLVALLKMIGCQVWQYDENGNQFRVGGYRGHAGGGLDGVALGIPEMPTVPVLTEYKTHNDKSFKKLQEEGVIKAKWEHFVQMQIYMGKMKLTHALYLATNKNDDDLHGEIIQFDPVQFPRYEQRAVMIIDATKPPPKINNSPGWYKCKFCDAKDICHGQALPVKNCRTCKFVRLVDNGGWVCDGPPSKILSKNEQRVGCDWYEMNQDFKRP